MSNTSVRCGKCGYDNRVNARFCKRCGADVALNALVSPAPTIPTAPSATAGNGLEFCPQCGQEITPGARFCRHCGQTLAPLPTPTNVESANLPLPQTQASPFPVNLSATGIPMTLPLNHPASSAQGIVATQPDALLTLTPLSAEPVFVNGRSAGRRFAFPTWAWAFVGFLFGLFAGIGLLAVRPELVELISLSRPANVSAPPTSVAPQPSTPGITAAPGLVITATQSPVTTIISPTASGGVTSTLAPISTTVTPSTTVPITP